ncbi:MAG TPA: molybdopterin cofactor-binding domain-containing protein [Terriglobales bacterium]|nr:molybdopterin cofactor-binding domain-containing protein [Terriglobales bacterium]
MSDNVADELSLEAAQHDAIRRLRYGFELGRRDFFKVMGGGVLVCVAAGPLLAQESGRTGSSEDEQLPQNISAWIHIAGDGKVTVYTGKAEMGQNIRTSLTQQVAEELRVPHSSIELVMGDTERTPFDMGTFGSRTTPTMGPQLRKAAAAARQALVGMAAQRWQTDPSSLVVVDGRITNPQTKQTISYAELSSGQQLTKIISDDTPLISASKWRVAGTPVAKVDGRAFVTGEHKYTSDMKRPGMMYGKVLRPRAFRAALVSLDSSEAEKLPGVKIVRDGNFVGVVAPSEALAAKALAALRAKWEAPQQPSDAELYSWLKNKPAAHGQSYDTNQPEVRGSIEQGLQQADKTLAATYTVAYIAHTPLEPRAALAEWKDGKLTVWTGSQRPFAIRDELAATFHLSHKQVRVIIPDTGSAYGGKHTGDAAMEAARLAKATGKPVKLVWTREEEFTWAYFRPAGTIDIKSGVRRDGTITVWQYDNYNSGSPGIATPYTVPNQRIEFHPSDSPLRQGSYRGLAAPANFFARESHMDELAHAISMDPLEFRLKNLNDSRLRAVFEAAAQKLEWGKQKSSPTRGFGLAGGTEKGGYVACCAEVAIDPSTREVQVRRVVEAFECGAIVNPDGLKNQISGAITQGLGGALFEAIHFDNGRIVNPHLAQYRVPRFSDQPEIDVVMLDRKDLPPSGAGETPIMAIAPAVANAIFNATGIRVRSLPLVPDGLKGSAS